MNQIVYLSPIEWSALWQRPQRLAVDLAKRFRVTYVEPVGMRAPRLRDWRRIATRVLAVDSKPTGMPIVRPRYLPWSGSPLVEQWNRRWLWRQLRVAAPALERREAELWIGAPNLLALTLLSHARPARVIYDCMDRFAEFHRGAAKQRIEQIEQAVLERSDLVFASSRELAEDLSRRHAHVVFAPNGVDAEHFSQSSRAVSHPALADLSRPVIGYHGTIGDWLDFELLEALAVARPDWSWAFVGPIQTQRAARFLALRTVHHFPPVSHSQLPSWVAGFDAGIVPFVANRLTQAALPVKLIEYLAAGLPVVATNLPSMSPFAAVVSLASSQDDWLLGLGVAVSADARTAAEIALRRTVAGRHTWRRTTEIIAQELCSLGIAAHQDAPRPTYRPAA